MAVITAINPPTVRAPTGYTHSMLITGEQRRLIISGQVGVAPDGSVPSTGEGQIAQAFANLRAVLEANGMSVTNLVKTTVFLTDRVVARRRSARHARRCMANMRRARRCCSSRGSPIRASWWRSRRKRFPEESPRMARAGRRWPVASSHLR